MKAKITNKELLSERTNEEQTLHLNELLGANENYFTREFIVPLMFKLPFDIIYNNRRGMLSIGPIGIEYTSLTNDYKILVAYSSTTIPHKDLYDCFIDILEFFRKNIDNIEILEAPDDCIIQK